MKPSRILILIVLAALALRIALGVLFVRYPGIADPNHYYNLGMRLSGGHGYTIDYIWQYNAAYPGIEHPDDYWMPLTAWVTAASMSVFGQNLAAALLPFVLLGSLLPLPAYGLARQFGVSAGAALFAAAACAFLPEFVLNSLRTDTTLLNAMLVCCALYAFTAGRRAQTLRRVLWWCVCGLCAGLAYLTRSENVLLVAACGAALAPALLQGRAGWREQLMPALVIPALALALCAPWLARTYALNGTFSTPTTSNMFWLTDYNDHYLFDTQLSLQTMLAARTPAELLGKRGFEMAASLKIMIVTLGTALPLFVLGGAALALGARGERRDWLRTLLPALLLLAAFFAFYTVLAPYKSQGGSFKKAYLSLIPALLPLAALALERALHTRHLQRGAAALVCALLVFEAADVVRLDASTASGYASTIARFSEQARALPDVSGDGQLALMTQDPFVLGTFGLRSVIYPQGDLDTVYRVAQRYGVDYLLMPSDRPAIDAVLNGPGDPRFTPVLDANGRPTAFVRIEPPA